MADMDDDEFDRTLVSAAFTVAGDLGWREVSVMRAARAGDLALDRARGRFLGVGDILSKFGRIADQSALAFATSEGAGRDRLFDLLMRRFDVLQAHRGGVLALKTFLPQQPGLALSLSMAHLVSMAFMLEGAGIAANGVRGALRTNGLVAVWLRVARAWERDDSEDLSATMAALDSALDRAATIERWMRWEEPGSAAPTSEEVVPPFPPLDPETPAPDSPTPGTPDPDTSAAMPPVDPIAEQERHP